MNNNSSVKMYVGTYAYRNNPGIYLINFDLSSLCFQLIASCSGIENPSYLTLNKARTRLYAVSETEVCGKLSAYEIEQTSGNFRLLNERDTLGGAPCFLMLDQTESVISVANYLGGNVNLFTVDEDGSLGDMKANIQHFGSSIRKDRQQSAHPHAAIIDPTNNFLLVPDLGMDQIKIYHLDLKQKRRFICQSTVQMPKGSGPRHLTFHPTLTTAYIINELNSTIIVMNYRSEEGELSIIQYVSTVPFGFKGENACADIHITPDGRFLYGSNRGHNSLVMYEVNSRDGTLTTTGFTPSGGKNPRNFCIIPDGSYLIAANQDSNNLVAFLIEESGKLIPVSKMNDIIEPVCIKI